MLLGCDAPASEPAMHWTSDTAGRTYTATQQGYQALIWRTSTGEWVAMISQHHAAIAHERCTKLKDAQRWCEAQISETLLSRLSRWRKT